MYIYILYITYIYRERDMFARVLLSRAYKRKYHRTCNNYTNNNNNLQYWSLVQRNCVVRTPSWLPIPDRANFMQIVLRPIWLVWFHLDLVNLVMSSWLASVSDWLTFSACAWLWPQVELLSTGSRSLVATRLVTKLLSQVAYCLSRIADCLSPIARCLSHIARCLLPGAYCLVPIA